MILTLASPSYFNSHRIHNIIILALTSFHLSSCCRGSKKRGERRLRLKWYYGSLPLHPYTNIYPHTTILFLPFMIMTINPPTPPIYTIIIPCAHVCMCGHTCMSMIVVTCMLPCAYIWMCGHMHVHTCGLAYMCDVITCMLPCAYTCMCNHMHVHTCGHMHVHTCVM